MQPNEHHCGELLDHSLTKGVRCLAPTYFHYTKDGKIARNFDQAANTSTDHVYLSGSLVASRKTLHASGTTEVTYQHTDALGTPVAFTDAAGNLVRRERMTAWGEPADGTWTNGPGYTGHQMDAGSKLVYMQQRYYDPVIGRFLSTDPVHVDPSTSTNFSRYWYANNNPLMFKDPDGRWVCKGSDADCGQFREGLFRAAEAAKSDNLSADEQKQLQRAVAFFGEEGDERVSVQFGDLGGPGGQAKMRDDGGHDITIDLGAADVGSKNAMGHLVARAIVHEGTHGANDRERKGVVGSRSERKEEERSGYRVQAIYQKAVRFASSSRDGWTPFTGISEENIERQAEGSVTAACGSSNDGSCR